MRAVGTSERRPEDDDVSMNSNPSDDEGQTDEKDALLYSDGQFEIYSSESDASNEPRPQANYDADPFFSPYAHIPHEPCLAKR